MNDVITDISTQLSEGVRALTSRLPVILSDPRAYPREAMLIAAIASLALVLLILVAVVVVDVLRARRRRNRLGVRRRSRWPAVAFVLALAIFILAVVSTLPATRFASPQCGSCHEVSVAVDRWEMDVHSTVSCYGCHSTGGLTGSVMAGVRGVVGLVSSAGRDVEGVPQSVFESRCLDCHEEIASGITQGQVRMRHSDVIESGFSCTTCHLGVGHGGEVARGRLDDRSVMGYCVGCHDGVAAAADCEVCHSGRPSDPSNLSPAGNTATRVTCVGCHAQKTDERCVSCHGLVLPHPGEFKGQHAGLSYRDPALCARCHQGAVASEGCGCHYDENMHGSYSEWFPRHGPQASETWPGGCNCHDTDFCSFCHETSPFAR